MIFSLTMLPPILVSLGYDDGAYPAFLTAFGITLVLGAQSWLPVRRQHRDLRLRDGFVVVVMFWTVLPPPAPCLLRWPSIPACP